MKQFFKIIIIFLVYTNQNISAQYEYKIDTFTQTYDTLIDYKSIVYEKIVEGDLPLSFSRDFDLGFEMPYWDRYISRISLDNYMIGLLDGSIEYNMFLFGADWEIYLPQNINEDTTFYSDFRYKTGSINDLKYFVLEFRHVAHNNFFRFNRPQNECGDFNFQTWFLQNGDIELRFGNMRTQDTTVFKDNFGLITGDENGDGQWNAGIIGIENYNNTEGIYYCGNYDKPKIIKSPLLKNETEITQLTTLPHEGFVIRFKSIMKSGLVGNNTKIFSPLFYPNPAQNFIYLQDGCDQNQVRVMDLNGKPQIIEMSDNRLGISHLAPGFYIIEMVSKGQKLHQLMTKL